jgi:SSS family solute:Na+ symporter
MNDGAQYGRVTPYEKELVGLVYSMTERPSEEHLAWFKRPIASGLAVIVLTMMLNLIFY